MGITSNTGTAGAKITKNGSKYSVLSGATLTVEGAGTTVTGALVSGFGRGSENQPGAVPGVSGGTDHPALVLLSAGGVASGATVGFGGVVMAVNKGSAVGGSAFNSGSFAAANGGIVDGATIGSGGGVLAPWSPVMTAELASLRIPMFKLVVTVWPEVVSPSKGRNSRDRALSPTVGSTWVPRKSSILQELT
ncbi:hypothetical protein [Asaia astilbis]|uniref:hypothetical protein n=1 Tax=Asaia astilbis TaxID=610244 RepID=UPI0012EBA29D|nr:hypothetical protein [Asaia astilbis]